MGRLQDLHRLLQSLDTSERRFIKRYQQGKYDVESQPGRLLDFLLQSSAEELEQFTPKALEARYGKSLPTVIARLRRFVLDLLVLQHGGKTVESRIHLALEEIRWLFDKHLWEEANRTVRQTQKLAEQFSYTAQALGLLEWERIIVQATLPSQAQARFQEIRSREIAIEALLRHQSQLKHLEFLIRDRGRRNLMSQSPLEKSEIAKLIQHPEVVKGLESDDFLTFSLSSVIQGSCHFYLGNSERSMTAFTRLFDAWTQRPKWIQEQPRRFIELVQLLIVSVLYSETGLDRYPQIMDYLEALQFSQPAHQIALQQATFQNSILVYMNTARLEEGLTLLQRLSPWLEKNAPSLTANTQLMFLHNSAVIYFIMARYQAARRTIRKILDFPLREARTDIRHFARLLECILNYELGDHELNEYQLLSTYQLYQRHGISPLQSKTLALLQTLAKTTSEPARQTVWGAYLEDLENMAPEVGKMELQIWAKAKRKSQSLQAIYHQLISEMNKDLMPRITVSLKPAKD